MTNEAAERLTLNQKLIRALHPGTDWDQYDREVRRATVERIANELGLDPGWEQRDPGVTSLNPFDVRHVLDEEAPE